MTTATGRAYLALVHKDEGTSYGVSLPDMPGCISEGDTFEEAVANAAEALAGHLALMKADGDPLPKPRSFEELRRDPVFREDSADAIVTMVASQPAMAAMSGPGFRCAHPGYKAYTLPQRAGATLNTF